MTDGFAMTMSGPGFGPTSNATQSKLDWSRGPRITVGPAPIDATLRIAGAYAYLAGVDVGVDAAELGLCATSARESATSSLMLAVSFET